MIFPLTLHCPPVMVNVPIPVVDVGVIFALIKAFSPVCKLILLPDCKVFQLSYAVFLHETLLLNVISTEPFMHVILK